MLIFSKIFLGQKWNIFALVWVQSLATLILKNYPEHSFKIFQVVKVTMILS